MPDDVVNHGGLWCLIFNPFNIVHQSTFKYQDFICLPINTLLTAVVYTIRSFSLYKLTEEQQNYLNTDLSSKHTVKMLSVFLFKACVNFEARHISITFFKLYGKKFMVLQFD